MSSLNSVALNMIVMHEGNNIVYDTQSNAKPCENISDIKHEIERMHGINVG